MIIITIVYLALVAIMIAACPLTRNRFKRKK